MAITPAEIAAAKDIELTQRVKQCKVDTSLELKPPPTILSIRQLLTVVKEYRIFTLGNISTIKGKKKSRKTFLSGMLLSEVIKGKNQYTPLVGEMPDNKKVCLYIDTEQGDWDSQKSIRRIEKMIGENNKKKFHGFNMRRYNATERAEMIEFIFAKYKDKICMCVIDGIADLVKSNNSEEEAKNVISMLMRLTTDYNCHILCVLHVNKADNYATGWIGSELEKKSEIIIDVSKDKEMKGQSIVECSDSRAEGFENFNIGINNYGYPYVVSEMAMQPYDYVEPIKTEKEIKDIIEPQQSIEIDCPF